MGIFDSFFKGPELTKDDALNMSTSMALNLYRDGYTIEQFIQNADMLLEEIFKMEFPHHSISTEQSKQILKNVASTSEKICTHQAHGTYTEKIIKKAYYFSVVCLMCAHTWGWS